MTHRLIFTNSRAVLAIPEGGRCSFIARAESRGFVYRHEAIAYIDEGVYKVMAQTICEFDGFMETPRLIVCPTSMAAIRTAIRLCAYSQVSSYGINP